jgi:hypothetical protein
MAIVGREEGTVIELEICLIKNSGFLERGFSQGLMAISEGEKNRDILLDIISKN